jgi:hypothetical protein
MGKMKDLTGQKFGKLMVIEEAYRKKNVYWKCHCDCGTETIVIGSGLRNGHTTSCGCNRINGAIKTAKKNLSKDPKLHSARNIYGNSYKDGTLTFEQFLELSQMPCYYCNTLPINSNVYNKYKYRKTTVLENISLGDFYYNGLDRIDNSRLHNFDNVVPCCKWCNTAKLTRTKEEFIKWIEQAYKTCFDLKTKRT